MHLLVSGDGLVVRSVPLGKCGGGVTVVVVLTGGNVKNYYWEVEKLKYTKEVDGACRTTWKVVTLEQTHSSHLPFLL